MLLKSTRMLATLACLTSLSNPASANDLADRMAHHRAIETLVWGMPILNFQAMRDGFERDAGVGNGDVAYLTELQTWKLQTTTLNNTTPYVHVFWNLSDGPMVIDIPATTPDVGLVGTLMDVWQRTMEEVGNAGYDGGRGAKYLLLPPGYRSAVPPGYVVIESPSNNGFTLLRPIIRSATSENMAKAADFAKQIMVYPLSEADNPTTRHVDITDALIDGVAHFDAGIFERLDAIIEEEPIEEKDIAFLGVAQSVGVEKGVPFAPDERMQAIHAAAAKDAEEFMRDEYLDRAVPPYYPDRNWSNAVPVNGPQTYTTWIFPHYVDYIGRGAGYFAFYTSFRRLGSATFYLKTSRDTDGDRMNGSAFYKLTIPADVPARNFWSVTAYSATDATWFNNQPRAGLDSIAQGVVTNEDGTVDVYFGPTAPEVKEANWVPTNEGDDYFLYFRAYGPEPAIFDKSWKLNDVEKLN